VNSEQHPTHVVFYCGPDLYELTAEEAAQARNRGEEVDGISARHAPGFDFACPVCRKEHPEKPRPRCIDVPDGDLKPPRKGWRQ